MSRFNIERYTFAEIEASLIYPSMPIHQAANQVILLAERIKAERAIVAMRG